MWSPRPPAGWPGGPWPRRSWDRRLRRFPRQTAIGALGLYVQNGSLGSFQPMNINFGIMEPLDYRVKGKRNKNEEISRRALAQIGTLK